MKNLNTHEKRAIEYAEQLEAALKSNNPGAIKVADKLITEINFTEVRQEILDRIDQSLEHQNYSS